MYLSQLFSVLGPQWWNELPADVRIAVADQYIVALLTTNLLIVSRFG